MKTEQRKIITIARLEDKGGNPRIRIEPQKFGRPGPYLNKDIAKGILRVARKRAKGIDKGEGKTFLQGSQSWLIRVSSSFHYHDNLTLNNIFS